MRTVIRASSAIDLLGYAPYRLGFRPRESVVLIGIRPPRGSVGLVMRLDLADVANDSRGADAVRHALELLGQEGSDDALVIVYTDLPLADRAAGSPVARAVQRLRTLTDWCDQPGPWVVGRERYGVWGPGEGCGPLTSPLSDIEYGTMAAELVMAGLTVAEDREDLGVEPASDPGRRQAAARAFRKARRCRTALLHAARAACDDDGCGQMCGRRDIGACGELAAWQRQQYDLWRRTVARVREGASIGAGELGRLLAAFEDTRLRDAAMTTALGLGALHLPTSHEMNHLLGLAMGPEGSAPGPHDLDPAVDVLVQAAGVAPRAARTAPLGMLAWLAWWAGDSARADVLSSQCLEAAPDYSLALLVRQAVVNHLPPGWAVQG